ncbi:MAG: hypothetical protein JNJ83_15140 [Verrucomicrobiaceae bacterium]|nr:hypothetical protein [Verrucomicrobiaceae bacterium]
MKKLLVPWVLLTAVAAVSGVYLAVSKKGSEVKATARSEPVNAKSDGVNDSSPNAASASAASEVKSRLEKVLQEGDAKETSKAVAQALKDANTEARLAAVDAAMAVEIEAGIPLLALALNNDQPAVRALAMEYVNSQDFEFAEQIISAALKDASPDAANDVLRILGEQPTMPMFESLLANAASGQLNEANTKLLCGAIASWLGEEAFPAGSSPNLEALQQYWSEHASDYSEGMELIK